MKPAPLPVLVIAGPTCTGKTAWGIHFARRLNGEVISADSRQLYRGMKIGTAQADPGEMQGVPHHLVGILEPGEKMDAGIWARRARPIIEAVHQAGRLPIIVGGTGFYLQALFHGIPAPAAGDPELRRRLKDIFRRGGGGRLHRWLERLDPQRAAEIHPANGARLTRALEIILGTGREVPRILPERGADEAFKPCWIGLTGDRALLYNRINVRVERMVAEGLILEVEQLAESVSPAGLDLLQRTIGYREVLQLLNNELDQDICIELIQRNTRHYAKRQMTWFRGVKEIRWFDALSDPGSMVAAQRYVEETLSLWRS